MSPLRDPQTRRELLLLCLLTVAGSAAAFLWAGARAAVLVLAACVILSALHFFFSLLRYRRIASLSARIDRILHGADTLELKRCEEGELAILETEIGKMTLRLRENARRLEEDKLFLSDALADVSHQLRTPLTAIHLLVSGLSDPSIDAGQRSARLRELSEQLARVDWLIDALLKMSRLDAGTVLFQPETFPVRRLLYSAAAPLEISMDLRGQTLSVNCSEDIFLARDLKWTGEALGNILKNCVEHTPENGTIALSARQTALFTEITVTDSGPGIAPEDLPHLFERFYRGSNATEQSVGIGLALARQIITAQEGSVKAENTGHGAKFTVRFYQPSD